MGRIWGSVMEKEAEDGGHEGVCRPGQYRGFAGPLCSYSGELTAEGTVSGVLLGVGAGSLSVLSAMRFKDRWMCQGLTAGWVGWHPSSLCPFPRTFVWSCLGP